MFLLPKVYPLTDVVLSGLSHAEQVRLLSEGGASLIQLREKEQSALDFYTQAEAALRVARQLGSRIVINDRVDIALAVGADGVHLGQDDLLPESARRLLGPNAIIGLSTHTVEQARLATALPVDYIAIGPIFRTRTKPDSAAELGLEGLRAVREVVGARPLVAIGGINHTNAAAVLEAGADSVAVISVLLADPVHIVTRTMALFQSL